MTTRRVLHAPSQLTKRSAFTLVELLTVVGILVFLIAVLIPALAKSQRQARTVTCLSNLRQFHLAFTTYRDMNNGRAMLRDPAHGFWMDQLKPMFGDLNAVRFCPEAAIPSYGWGGAHAAWGPYDATRSSPSIKFVGENSSSYGLNGWLYDVPDKDDEWLHGILVERIPVFADANWVEGWPGSTAAFLGNPEAGADAREAEMGRFTLTRHGRSINAVMLDGHAEQLPLEALVHQIWSKPPGLGRMGEMSVGIPSAPRGP